MNVRSSIVLVSLAAVIVGCGGSSGGSSGNVAGVIFDESGNVVRGAAVFFDGDNKKETTSNSSGAFVLSNVTSGNSAIQATVERNGIRYFGQNVATVLANERTKNVNIAVYPVTQLAKLQGRIRNVNGELLSGVRVFARQESGDVLSSSITISNSDGFYELEGLRSGLNYNLQANAQGFSTDFDNVILSSGEVRTLDFRVGNGTDPALSPPNELFALAWTSPREITRDREQAEGIEAVKQMLSPNRKRIAKSRSTVNGNYIEVDLTWDGLDTNSHLGYGIYRAIGNGAFQGIDFLRDPLAEIFVDLDDNLVEGINYSYSITALSTSYPDTPNSESNFSPEVSATPLGDILNTSVVGGPLQFNWSSAFGASQYSVFLWTEFPSIGTTAFFNNFSTPVSGTSFTYNGPNLSPGRTYFYVVVGRNSDDSARTISRISQFVAP